ncbi:MAG: serine/threonine-protein kinase, partial [Gemmatimonadota bacterium]|nr:serine/threonine-protein kinase [Gemmatimonadota bacterium]
APELAQALGPERFLREIEIAAQLSHPRIVPLLDSGSADGLLFYVMPFVEGESVRQRLVRERQLPVDDALEISRQAAAALAYAHSRGVVHRDIKPENILLSGGETLVADFGIARAVEAAGASRLTETGLAVGTPTYMSPEQAAGEMDVDGRSDIYSLGCVLYEMLAGEPPFTGPTAQAITARKLGHPAPNVAMVRESAPPAVAEAVRKALAPVPADRYATATQFAEALRPLGESARAQHREPVAGKSWGRERALWLTLGAVVALLAAFGARWWPWGRAPDPAAPVRAVVSLPPGVRVTRGPGYPTSSVALSPDGRTLVIAGTSADGQRLYRRPLDRLEATPLAGTEGGSSPFFSPDGAWIGFFADGGLRKLPAGGGAAVDIGTVPGFLAGVSWSLDDRIVFGSGVSGPVYAVGAGGGDAQRLTRLEGSEIGHRHPQILPDARTLLFETGGRIYAVDLTTGRRAVLAPGTSPRHAASGHLIFGRGTTLLGARFDPARLTLTGPAVPLVEGVARAGAPEMLHYSISRSGALAYVPGAMAHELVLVDADGKERLLTGEWLAFENPQFSPDGRRLAVATGRRLGDPADIWIHDLRTGAASRLTFEGGRAPVWRPDGAAVTFSKLGDRRGIYTKAADGGGDAELLLAIDEFHWLVGWTPDGRSLAFGVLERTSESKTLSSIVSLTAGESRRVVGPGSIWGGRLSPDGRWLAYYTLESGRFQVFVTPFPGGRARWLISEEGGRDPTWGSDGTEVYYRSGDRLVAARIDTTAGVRVLRRRLVLAPFSPPLYDDYDIHPDGRTLTLVRPRDESGRDIVLVLDWFTEVRRAAGR